MSAPSPATTEGGSRLLDLRGLVAGYGDMAVVHGIDLHVDAGEVVALLGTNGAGKTTTLLTVSGVLPLLGGELTVLGEPRRPGRTARATAVTRIARRGVAHVPEDRGLFYELTAEENLRLGTSRRLGVVRPLPIERILGWFPALERVMGRRSGLLSGGEQQMVALARAMISRPRLLMVDEMSLGLSPLVVEELLPVFRSFADEFDAGVLMVEQHVALALEVADRAYVLDRGRVATWGTADEVAKQPELIESGYLGAVDPTEPTP